jgi:ComF family protein
VWEYVDVLFPPRCAGCEKWGERYCTSCQDQTKLIRSSICQVCGEPQLGTFNTVCRRCTTAEIFYTELRSWALFDGPLQKAIHKLKYKRDLGLGEKFARPLFDLLRENHWKIDLVTAVPLDNTRRKERGFNQSLYLARPLALEAKLPIMPSAIERIKITKSQVGLSLEERRVNVADAFFADRRLVGGKSILIIDDVVTTGSTINSCAEAFMKSGSTKVYGLTLARSIHL